MGRAWKLDVRGWEQMFGEQVGAGLQFQPRAKLYSVTKNVLRLDRSDVVPARSSTSSYSSPITDNTACVDVLFILPASSQTLSVPEVLPGRYSVTSVL